jgi:ankyrin repeat protein
MTPLHVAAWKGHIAVARALVDRGADLGLRDEEGQTPFEQAASSGHAELAESLRSRGGIQ